VEKQHPILYFYEVGRSRMLAELDRRCRAFTTKP
jgi:hypothetical protein